MAGFGGAVKLTGADEYKKALQQITQNLKEVSSEMKVVTSAYDKNDKSEEALSAKTDVLNKKLGEQEKYLATLKSAYASMQTQFAEQTKKHDDLVKSYESEKSKLDELGRTVGTTSKEYQDQEKKVAELAQEVTKSTQAQEANEKSMSDMRVQINKAQADINKTDKSMEDLTKEEEKNEKQTDKNKKSFEGFGDTLKKVGTAIGATLGALATASVAVGKKVWDMANDVASAGDEIDKSSQKLGVSAENYQKLSYAMERNGTSIDTVSKGVKKITNDLADAENGVDGAGESFDKLGVSLKNTDGSMKTTEQVLLESIDALSKMENETQRNALAQEIFGKSASELNPLLNAGADSLAELMQEAEDYGMVMSDEAVSASATFADSLTKMQGTLTGLKNNMIGELLPSLTMVTDGFADLIAGNEGAGEAIQQGIGGVIQNLTEMIPQFVELVSSIAQAVMENAPAIIRSLAEGILSALPEIIPVAMEVISEIASTMIDMLPELVLAGVQIIVSLMDGIKESEGDFFGQIIDVLADVIEIIVEWLPDIISSGTDIIVSLIEGIINALPKLIAEMPRIISSIIDTLLSMLPQIIDCGVQLLVALINNMPAIISGIVNALPTLITGLINGLMQNLPAIINAGVQLFTALIMNLPQIIIEIVKALPSIISAIVKGLISAVPQIAQAGLDLIKGLWQGISNATEWIWSKIKGFMSNVVGKIKNFFGIHSPSTLFEDEIGANLALGLGEGFSDEMQTVTKEMQDSIPTSFDTTANLTSSASGYAVNSFEAMLEAFKQALTEMKIVLDDEVAGQFVENTVTRVIYS